MKNLMIYVNPRKDFDDEGKIAIKIQIDNSFGLGWKKEDIILATNFPFKYKGVKAIQIGDENYCTFCGSASKINAIITLFEKKLIKNGELYWFHDIDAFQLVRISTSELDMNNIDLLMPDFGRKPRWSTGSIFFNYKARDIFSWCREIVYKYKTDNEEKAMWILTGHDERPIWKSKKLVKGYTIDDNPQLKNINKRIKKLNISYNFHSFNAHSNYKNAIKPIKVAHFHILPTPINHSNPKPNQINFFMRGVNKLDQQIIPERLLKIFSKHGIRTKIPKNMKNLIIYINLSGKLPKKEEKLVKEQIENSLKLGWNKKDIILATNFPYIYKGVKATVFDNSTFTNLDKKAYKFNVLCTLCEQGKIDYGQLWWYHDLNIFQLKKIEWSEIDLENTYVGFNINNRHTKFTNSFFFRKGCHKIFGWTRNRLNKLQSDDKSALISLTKTNYRNINSMYKMVDFANNTIDLNQKNKIFYD